MATEHAWDCQHCGRTTGVSPCEHCNRYSFADTPAEARSLRKRAEQAEARADGWQTKAGENRADCLRAEAALQEAEQVIARVREWAEDLREAETPALENESNATALRLAREVTALLPDRPKP